MKKKILFTLIPVSVIISFITPVKQYAKAKYERVQILIEEHKSSESSAELKEPIIENLAISVNDSVDTNKYQHVIKYRDDMWKGNLILVNGNYACKFLQGIDLREVKSFKNNSYKIIEDTIKLNAEMIDHLNGMMRGFEKSTGKHDIILTSGYRTLKDQQIILQEKINLLGEEGAHEWAMLPKYSEHHTGYAVDVSIYTDSGNYIRYKGQNEYGWINQNCHKYGFIRRYADDKQHLTGIADEEWHYRYVGVPHATIIYAKNFCLEEYIDYLKDYPYGERHLKVESDLGKYEIYFVQSNGRDTKVPVPIGKEYTVSGNNIDGFIVTVKK